MTRKLKPVETDLEPDIQEAVLSLPVSLPDGTIATVGDLVQRAEDNLRLANEAVRNNALIQKTASFLMKQDKRRGFPTVVVHIDGTAALRISYSEDEEPLLPDAPSSTKSSLPSLDELRERAMELGVDIKDLGRAKRKIIERLQVAADEHLKMRDEVSESPMPDVILPGRPR